MAGGCAWCAAFPFFPMTVSVLTETSAGRLFDYAVPPELADRVKPGQRVRVPFGSRTITGYIASVRETPQKNTLAGAGAQPPAQLSLFGGVEAPRLRVLTAIEDDVPFFSPVLLKLASWMAQYFFAPPENVLRCILPAAVRNPGAKARVQLYVEAVQPPPPDAETPTPRQAEVLAGIIRVGGGWLSALPKEFSCTEGVIRALEKKKLVTVEPLQRRRDPLARRRVLPTTPLPLAPEQAAALAQILEALDEPAKRKPLLLFGVTGSGKTEVYLQAIAHVLERGAGAIVMVPEIALTPQTVQRFAGRFGKCVAVLHSALGDGERFDEWHRIRTGEAKVVVGPRSAVFAPVQRLGMIIVDEEHEPSYKQEDSAPLYNGRDVAVMRAHLEGCAVVLGSATPCMETWRNVLVGKYAVAKMRSRVAGRPMPAVNVVDMRLETARAGHAQIFSGDLLEALKLRLERGQQSILFLNRRGYATSLTCPKCGYTAECGDCSIAYTYHRADDCLRCHICGAWKPVPARCPECGDPAFRYSGFGTQRVELALQKCFPGARILRMDADVTARKHSHDEILSIFRAGRADILIGTQMIAKGLDFPNVTLVGVLMADTSLNLPDFRAGERTYQLLAQVSGRAGRAELPGEVFIQTYTPGHPAIRAAAGDDGFEPFASQELAERAEGRYPPYEHLTCLTFKGPDEERLKLTAEQYAADLKAAAPSGVRVSDAVPCSLSKAKGLFRYQVLLFAPATRAILNVLRTVLSRRPVQGDVSLLVDVDALNLG